MASKALSVSLGLALASLNATPTSAAQANGTNDVEWTSCKDFNADFEQFDEKFQCGYYNVPLDWADESAGTARLALAKYPAADENKKGTIFLNPGGPGGSGVEFVLGIAERLASSWVGTAYDLVGWDPRGTRYSTPGLVHCFESMEEQTQLEENSLLANFNVDVTNALLDADDVNAFYSQMNDTDRLYRKYFELCVERAGDKLKYLGTPATVRDIVALADYLEPDAKEINYYGASYGTIIGATLVNMFPDRVGRVAIDGVVDPQLYAGSPGYETITASVQSRDAAFLGFAKECAKAGDRCSLRFHDTDTGDDIVDLVYGLLKSIYDLLEAGQLPEDIPTPQQITAAVLQQLYTPTTWSTLADYLRQIYDALNGGADANARRVKREDTMAANSGDSLTAISCGDSIDAGNTTIKNSFDEILFVTRNVSPMFGPTFTSQGTSCYAWPVRAVERYSGPWNNKLSNKILVIGNQADPVTPFKNAKQISDQLGDSAVLIEQSGYGHSSLAEFSNCTTKIMYNYFNKGEYPDNDNTYCFVEEDNYTLFPDSSNSTSTNTTTPPVDGSPTEGEVANALSDTKDMSTTLLSATSDDDDDAELADLRKTKSTLMATTIAFGALSAVLGAALVLSMVSSLRNKAKYSRVKAADILEPAWAARQSVSDPYSDTTAAKSRADL
ncbi:TAP-like protein-domain-containing protein [Schizophyllum amplum]|uniref:TAP-like protein-domain-containing protein n=1 Tax=Schizophyllum amplum TaxID=97359 RepID=A0A550C7H4_9AGAR|nr:TAP-like protein-domain-containing protein [Auriculariopsis ampla]